MCEPGKMASVATVCDLWERLTWSYEVRQTCAEHGGYVVLSTLMDEVEMTVGTALYVADDNGKSVSDAVDLAMALAASVAEEIKKDYVETGLSPSLVTLSYCDK